uniref:Uncharacterized protein n=1 Tax=Aegilops tauschii TaxID=37682 RepID=M8AYS3_AEGTA
MKQPWSFLLLLLWFQVGVNIHRKEKFFLKSYLLSTYSDSKDMWMIIWVHGKYRAMIMTMFRFMMKMMDAFSFDYVVGMLFLLDDVPRRSFS